MINHSGNQFLSRYEYRLSRQAATRKCRRHRHGSHLQHQENKIKEEITKLKTRRLGYS